MSVRHGARPVTTSGSDSSNCRFAGQDAGRHLDERLPLELVVEAHAVEGRQRVRAREGRDAVDVEPDESVGRARRAAARRGRRGQVGELARGDHAEQVVGAVVERDLLPRRRARLAEVRVAGQHADRDSAAAPLRARTIGTARTRVGVSSNQSGDAESTIRPVWNASRTCVRHCGRTRSPTMSR